MNWVLVAIAAWLGVAVLVAVLFSRSAIRRRDEEVEATVRVAVSHLDEDYRRLCREAR